MNKVRIYHPTQLADLSLRDTLMELLKSKERFDRSAKPLDAAIQEHIEWVTQPELADIYLLPHDWSHYYQNGLEKEAIGFCNEAAEHNKIVLSYSGGDQGITVPVGENTIVYRQSGYRSKLRTNERTAPFFLSDPIEFFLETREEDVVMERLQEKPIVGFCGMAPHGVVTGIKECTQIIRRNVFNKPFDKQEILSSSNLRYKTLEKFANSQKFESNYIIRQKYRGGSQSPENRKKTTNEYYKNQIDSDFVVCVRGVGNFSLRFYESLAMGSIPIFIDTDSPLPDISPLNWNEYIVVIDKKNISRADELVVKWMDGKNLFEQKQKCRELWKSHFRVDNFWINELNKLRSASFAAQKPDAKR